MLALAWNLLIPNFEGGMNFDPDLPLETIEAYLYRAKTLKRLNLGGFQTYPVLALLTQLKSLSCLKLPDTDDDNSFPFDSISHLTSLTEFHRLPGVIHNDSIYSLGDPYRDPEPSLSLLKWFTNVKRLTVSDPHQLVVDEINQMTRLEYLWSDRDIALEGEADVGDGFSRLTRLQSLILIPPLPRILDSKISQI